MEKLYFEAEQTDIIDENPNSQFAIAKIRVFSSGYSRNDTYCSEEALQATAHTIDNKPLVYRISNMFDDFSSHNEPEKTLIAGFVVPKTQEFERLEDGRLSLNVKAMIWKKYAPKAMSIFKRDGGKKKISVELNLLEGKEDANGITDMKDFDYTGVCILGDLITEASPNAELHIMSFAQSNEEYKKAYEMEFGSYEDIDLQIPEKVKSNIGKGLMLYKENGRGGTSVSLASARYVSKNEKITVEKVRHIAKVHKSGKFKNMVKNPPNDEYISYMLYGGKEGMEWSSDVENKLNEQDKKRLFYFSEELTFPYKSIGEINPALKGIDPPISLAQANHIASVADSIGSDEEKNGWAIAIAQFKKTHKVVDGKWVKKETMDMEDEKQEMALEPEKDMASEPEKDMASEPEKDMAKEPEGEKVPEKDMASEETPKEEEKPEEEKMSEKEPEKEEEPEKDDEDKEEPKNEEMSLDQNLDVKATLALLSNETDAFSNLVKEEFAKEEKDYAKMFEAMCGKMCKMAEENKELKVFKAGVEEREFNFEVQTTMKYIEDNSTLPQDRKDYLLEEAKKFSLDKIDAWKNLAKAEAFSFAKVSKEESKMPKYGNPWGTKDAKKSDSVWNQL